MTAVIQNRRPEAAHIWDREENEHYVEPLWVGRRLFDVERFDGLVCDPCCGLGNMLAGAEAAGLPTEGYDLVDRGAPQLEATRDFLTSTDRFPNFVGNPPFELGREFALHALSLAERKVAFVYPLRRLPAAWKWLKATPLYRVWLLCPRPSMPPGHEYVELQAVGRTPSGGKQDFVILVWLKGYEGIPTIDDLQRDGASE